MASANKPDILLVEAFCGGSHSDLIYTLHNYLGERSFIVSLTAKKWHWRARTSALYMSQVIPLIHKYRVLFASSVLNMAELVALRPDLAGLYKILYFHENQLVYPVRHQRDRDFQYGYNQIVSSLVADCVVFNSQYNMTSFLSSINSHLKLMPDARPRGLPQKISPKCRVISFPINFCDIDHLHTSKVIPNTSNVVCDTYDITSSDSTGSDVPNNDLTGSEVTGSYSTGGGLTGTMSSSDTNSECLMSRDDASNNCGNDISALLNCDSRHKSCSCLHRTPDKMHTESMNSPAIPCEKCQSSQSDDCNHVMNRSKGSGDGGENEGSCCTHSVKCEVSEVSPFTDVDSGVHVNQAQPLHIVWCHRWEHDKNPDSFFQALLSLSNDGYEFHVSVLGESFTDVPSIFEECKTRLSRHIHTWGYQPCKAEYLHALQRADVAVSTATHEFFGVAMLEAVHCGCYPLCPNRLVYPEIFPAEYLYNTDSQLEKRLRYFCRKPHTVRQHVVKVDTTKYNAETLKPIYMQLLVPQT